MIPSPPPRQEDIELFSRLIAESRYDFVKLVYLIFPFGQKGHALEHKIPYPWQLEELEKLSRWLKNPLTRYETYRLAVSSGNGAAKTALGAMINLCLMYTQRLRARVTANTDPQMKTVVWPEYDKWFRYARFHDHFFEKFGTSIKARKVDLADTWRIDTVNWSEESATAMSGLHNEGYAVAYTFEEAPGIPANIWQYASGAFTELNTIKVWMAFGNSDDPDSKFEQNMNSKLWHSRRIDTRTLEHIDPKQIEAWLIECGGDEDADDFRVRVRGLPRKTAKDSIIRREEVEAALVRGETFDKTSVGALPVILGVDCAWTGGDETCIWYQQGNYRELLERYKLDKTEGENHMITYNKVCYWEMQLKADAVHIDQAEGTALYTLGMNAGKTTWFLFSFAQSPTDKPESKDSEYGNLRAMMYFMSRNWIRTGGAIGSRDPKWREDIIRQLTLTKGTQHKITLKRMAEPKADIKARVGFSPDIADSFVLIDAMPVLERLPENLSGSVAADHFQIGDSAYRMPEHKDPYQDIEADYREVFD